MRLSFKGKTEPILELASLQKKMRKEPQLDRQLAMNKQVKEKRKQLEELKNKLENLK